VRGQATAAKNSQKTVQNCGKENRLTNTTITKTVMCGGGYYIEDEEGE